MSRSPLPERPRRYRFALTPLADAMFQLLIFFMLSSSLTPYSLLTLKSAPAAEAPEGEQPEPRGGEGEAVLPVQPQRWDVGRDQVFFEGQTFRLDQLVDLAEGLGQRAGGADVILVILGDARIQDVASAMEALQQADITALQIIRQGG